MLIPTFGIVLEQDGLRHWAPINADSNEIPGYIGYLKRAGVRAWVLCERGEGRLRHSLVSTDIKDVTCLMCLALSHTFKW
jgi:hypothetical protein